MVLDDANRSTANHATSRPQDTHNIRKFSGDFVDDLVPQNHTIPHGIGLGHVCEQFPGTSLRELERISGDPLDTDTREDGDLCNGPVISIVRSSSRSSGRQPTSSNLVG